MRRAAELQIACARGWSRRGSCRFGFCSARALQAEAGKVDCRGKPAPKPHTLEFDSKDGKLEPSPATKKLLLEFQSLADD